MLDVEIERAKNRSPSAPLSELEVDMEGEIFEEMEEYGEEESESDTENDIDAARKRENQPRKGTQREGPDRPLPSEKPNSERN